MDGCIKASKNALHYRTRRSFLSSHSETKPRLHRTNGDGARGEESGKWVSRFVSLSFVIFYPCPVFRREHWPAGARTRREGGWWKRDSRRMSTKIERILVRVRRAPNPCACDETGERPCGFLWFSFSRASRNPQQGQRRLSRTHPCPRVLE